MKNLYILHTQYNIILGTGILLNRFKEAQNDLVVYAEFTLTDAYKRNLESVYDHVLYIREKFEPAKVGLLANEIVLAKEWRQYKDSPYYRTCYDNIFISQDRALEALIVGYSIKKNKNCNYWDIEEDCYYSIDPAMNALDYNPGWHTRRTWAIRKILYGSTYFTEKNKGKYIYGQSSYFNGIYAIFPNLIRPQLSDKQAVDITVKEIVDGTTLLYNTDKTYLPNNVNTYLFFFDLLERYNNLKVIKLIVEQIVSKANNDSAAILLKYHPRETNKFDFNMDNIFEIPSIIPAEKILCDLKGRKVTVYGNATTSVIVSAKFGFNTVSIAGIEGSNNTYMIEQFENMGIRVPKDISDI